MNKKPFRTSKENKKGRNLKSINKLSDKERYNKVLIQQQKKGNLPGYCVVNKGTSNEYLRSNPDRTKKNNLDPMLSKRRKKMF